MNLKGNYKGNIKKTFKISKADQNAPAVQSTDETISGKKDGVITAVNSTMEYRKDGETEYTAISGDTIVNLAAGKYYVRVKGDSNHNPSPDTEVIIEEGTKPTVTVPESDTNSPQTEDNSNLWLWFALLFISGAGIFGFVSHSKNEKPKKTK